MPTKGDYICRTCDKGLRPRQASEHHSKGHDVWHVNPQTGELDYLYGQGMTRQKPAPSITGKGDEHIYGQFKGYETDDNNIVFILNVETGKIMDFRYKYPLVFPIYELCQKEPINYGGHFDQFLADMIESMFAFAGWELALAPKSQAVVYDEVVRLKEEGAINVSFDDQGKIKLEVASGNKGKHPKSRARATASNHKPTPEDPGGQKEAAKSE